MLFEIREHSAALSNALYGQPHVRRRNHIDELRILADAFAVISRRRYRRLDLLEQSREMAELGAIDRALDRAASGVAQDDDDLSRGRWSAHG